MLAEEGDASEGRATQSRVELGLHLRERPLVHLAAHLEAQGVLPLPHRPRDLKRLRHAAILAARPVPHHELAAKRHTRALRPVVDHAARVNRPAVGARVGRPGERPERRHRQRRLPSAVGAERRLFIHDRHERVVAVGELVGGLAARRPLQQQQPAAAERVLERLAERAEALEAHRLQTQRERRRRRERAAGGALGEHALRRVAHRGGQVAPVGVRAEERGGLLQVGERAAIGGAVEQRVDGGAHLHTR